MATVSSFGAGSTSSIRVKISSSDFSFAVGVLARASSAVISASDVAAGAGGAAGAVVAAGGAAGAVVAVVGAVGVAAGGAAGGGAVGAIAGVAFFSPRKTKNVRSPKHKITTMIVMTIILLSKALVKSPLDCTGGATASGVAASGASGSLNRGRTSRDAITYMIILDNLK